MSRPRAVVPHIGPRYQLRRYTPAATGLLGIVAAVVGADVWGARTDRPTISATVADCLDHQVAAPIVVGILAGLGWHLSIDPIIRKLARR